MNSEAGLGDARLAEGTFIDDTGQRDLEVVPGPAGVSLTAS